MNTVIIQNYVDLIIIRVVSVNKFKPFYKFKAPVPLFHKWDYLPCYEMFFSKMARSMLRGIRADSKDDLKKRMLEYIQEINNEPVIFTWKWKMDEMPGGITL